MIARHSGWFSLLVIFALGAALGRQPPPLAADDPKPGAVVLQCKGYIVAKGAVGIRIRLEVPEGDTALRPEMSAVVTILAAS